MSMIKKQNDGIFHLSNTLLNDGQISLKAKGLFLNLIFFILSNEKKGLTLEEIKKTNQIDSERSIKMGINELEKAGYIIRNTPQNGEVSWTYNLKMNLNEEIDGKVNISNEEKRNQRDNPSKEKVQSKKNTRKRKTPPKTGIKHTLSSIFKEFF
jgi:hypothetical protein